MMPAQGAGSWLERTFRPGVLPSCGMKLRLALLRRRTPARCGMPQSAGGFEPLHSATPWYCALTCVLKNGPGSSFGSQRSGVQCGALEVLHNFYEPVSSDTSGSAVCLSTLLSVVFGNLLQITLHLAKIKIPKFESSENGENH